MKTKCFIAIILLILNFYAVSPTFVYGESEQLIWEVNKNSGYKNCFLVTVNGSELPYNVVATNVFIHIDFFNEEKKAVISKVYQFTGGKYQYLLHSKKYGRFYQLPCKQIKYVKGIKITFMERPLGEYPSGYSDSPATIIIGKIPSLNDN